jgi:hypothetical protein
VVLRLYLTLLRPRRLGICVYGSATNSELVVIDLVHYRGIRLATGATNDTFNPEMQPFPDQGMFCKKRC